MNHRELRQKRTVLRKEIDHYAFMLQRSWETSADWPATEVWANELRGCVEALIALCGQPTPQKNSK